MAVPRHGALAKARGFSNAWLAFWTCNSEGWSVLEYYQNCNGACNQRTGRLLRFPQEISGRITYRGKSLAHQPDHGDLQSEIRVGFGAIGP